MKLDDVKAPEGLKPGHLVMLSRYGMRSHPAGWPLCGSTGIVLEAVEGRVGCFKVMFFHYDHHWVAHERQLTRLIPWNGAYKPQEQRDG